MPSENELAELIFSRGQAIISGSRKDFEDRLKAVNQASGRKGQPEQKQASFRNCGLDEDIDKAINDNGDQPEIIHTALLFQIVRKLSEISELLKAGNQNDVA